MFYAHSADHKEDWEPLRRHLECVAERTARYAAAFGAGAEGRASGLLHDLGKYGDLFSRRLEGKERGLDHWSVGAWVALQRYRKHGVAAALAVQGHHLGLANAGPDHEALRGLEPHKLEAHHPLGLRLTESNPELLLRRLAEDGLVLPEVAGSCLDLDAPRLPQMLATRLLFSALVDADFLETEAHFGGQAEGRRRYRPEGPGLRAAEALEILDGHLDDLGRTSTAAPDVLALRRDLLDACRRAACKDPGLFTLTAPTGSGKTLAMLAFALEHARHHGLERVVVAIPYLTILEQTAREYSSLLAPHFGDLYVLEHHSLADTSPAAADEADEQSAAAATVRLLAENWDAPLVVTTNVQLLESLFANRPARCRKLHRLAKSVILLDEVQTLPPKLAVSTLGALASLARRGGSTVVFATATQPAFEHLDTQVTKVAGAGWRPDEIASTSLELFERARRTEVAWRLDAPIDWPALAYELAARERALCVVNLKRHARALAEELKGLGAPGLLHLSTNLCPAHRKRVVKSVRRRLKAGEPCLLISTQCVEAGVDVDFPAVYRAFGPLDSIAQAAGRCNRNGRGPGLGEVVVFLPEDEAYPPGAYQQAAEVTRTVLEELGEIDLDDPELFRHYYRQFYDLTKITEAAGDLDDAIRRRDFPEVSKLYRLIAKDAINVVVPYDPAAFAKLRRELAETGRLTGAWVRRARSHAVSLYRPKPDDDVWNVLDAVKLAGGKDADDWFLHLEEKHYDRELLGLIGGEGSWIA